MVRCPHSVVRLVCHHANTADSLASSTAEVWGVDPLPTMVEAARPQCPAATVVKTDMQSLELGRQVDLVTAPGGVLSHALTDGELTAALDALARHTSPGGLVVIDWHADCALPRGPLPTVCSTRLTHEGRR